MFILPTSSSKPVCLIHCETLEIIKSGNVSHTKTKEHKSFDLHKSELRAQKINDLRAQYDPPDLNTFIHCPPPAGLKLFN